MLQKNISEIARALGIDPKTLPAAASLSGVINALESRSDIIFEETDLTDDEYDVMAPHLPPDPRGEGNLSNRTVLDALIWVQARGRALTHLPDKYGKSDSIRKRGERWAVSRVWNNLFDALADLNLPERRRVELRRLCLAYIGRGERIRRGRLRLR
jgi:transposase